MEINKKIYKYTAVISLTIVLMLIINLFKPMITIADSTYGISSINYDQNEEVMTVTCNKLDYHVNSFLYWVSTEEDIPTKDDLDKLADWCVNNAIKVVPLNSNESISDSIQIKKTGKYYAVMILKKADEEGKEEYVKAFIARYVVNTPIKKDDLKNQIEIEKEAEKQPVQEPVKEEEEQPAQEPVKEEKEQPAQETVREEKQPVQEPEKETEKQPTQEPKKEVEQQLVQENENKSSEDKPVYVNVNVNGEKNNNIMEDEYIDVAEEEPKEVDNNQAKNNAQDEKKGRFEDYINKNIEKVQNEKNKKDEEMKVNVEHVKEAINNMELESNIDKKQDSKTVVNKVTDIDNKTVEKNNNVENEAKKETKVQETNSLPHVDNKAKEPIPQTGNDNAGLIIGIVIFSIIGLGSLVKYIKLK